MTSDTKPPGGWPGAPGVPLHPERDGWHWVENHLGPQAPCLVPRFWKAGHGGGWDMPRAGAICWYRYIGPCLTPTELAAREAAAREAGMREAAGIAVSAATGEAIGGPRTDMRSSIYAAILAAIDKKEPTT